MRKFQNLFDVRIVKSEKKWNIAISLEGYFSFDYVVQAL